MTFSILGKKITSVCSQDQEKADLLRRATRAHREYTDMVSALCAARLGGFTQQMRVLRKEKTLRTFTADTAVWLFQRSGSDLTVL